MSKLSVGLALILIASCASCTGAADPAPSHELRADPSDAAGLEQHRRDPVLSGRALWTAEGAAPDSGRCFGVAVAVADLDGDGYRDVIVGEAPCLLAPLTPIRIAIYRGGRSLPSTTPVWTELEWPNPLDVIVRLALAVGDVDGDGRDDLIASSVAGVQVFAGITDVGAPLGAPAFRLPGASQIGRVVVADVNGDHRTDIITTSEGAATVWLSTGRAGAWPFTPGRVIAPVTTIVAVGDTNRDGKDDMIMTNVADSQLLLGCRAREPDCDGGLRAAPAFTTTEQPVIGMIPDLNHDGLSEALVTDIGFDGVGSGRVWLYLSDRSTGGLATTAVWSTLGDPAYPGFAHRAIVPGDLDGDHRSTEFVLSSGGRIYAFFPRLDQLATMQPGFAWPREDTKRDQLEAGDLIFNGSQVIAAAGDVNRDHVDDLVVADVTDAFGTLGAVPGRVHLIAGGRLPVHGDPPFLPGPHVCRLPDTGKPDLTVDQPALARSMFVENLAFSPDACEIAEGCVGGPGVRRLLRFATSVANFGGAPAIIAGPDTAPELYHFNECENEPELDGFAQYDLIDATGTTIAIGRKQSVFLIDVASNCIDGGPATNYLPDQGVSPGWGDVYVASTPCNWLDATDIPDGRYTLRVSVDVNHLIDQDDVLPDTASVNIALAGNTVTILP